MPRKSSAALSVIPYQHRTRLRLAPSDRAPAAVRQVFVDIVRSVPDGHLRPGDEHLVEALAQAIVLSREAAAKLDEEGAVVDGQTNAWLSVLGQQHKAISALSMRLRLSPQHRTEAKVAGRHANDPRPSVYDVMGDADD